MTPDLLKRLEAKFEKLRNHPRFYYVCEQDIRKLIKEIRKNFKNCNHPNEIANCRVNISAGVLVDAGIDGRISNHESRKTSRSEQNGMQTQIKEFSDQANNLRRLYVRSEHQRTNYELEIAELKKQLDKFEKPIPEEPNTLMFQSIGDFVHPTWAIRDIATQTLIGRLVGGSTHNKHGYLFYMDAPCISAPAMREILNFLDCKLKDLKCENS